MTDWSVSMDAVAKQARHAQYEQRRDTILGAAREVFSRVGFAAAAVEDVAEQAGIGKGTLYLYFRSKEEIYLACLVEEVHELMRQTREELSRAGDFRAQLRAFFRIRFEFCEKHEAFYRVYQAQYSTLFTKGHAIPKELRQVVLQALDFVTGVVEEAIEAGEIRKVPARSTAGAILDIARGIADKRLLGFSSLSPDEELEFLVDFVWHALAEPSAALAVKKRKPRGAKA